MKVETSRRTSFNVGQETLLGNGTKCFQEGLKVILAPGKNDTVLIKQLQNKLQIIVNGTDKAVLNQKECKNFEIRGAVEKVQIDSSVSLPIRNATNLNSNAPHVEKFAKAKQQSAAFRAALRKKTIGSDFKPDPFLGHISSQLHKLAQQFGGDAFKSSSPVSQQQLLPRMNELVKILEFQTAFNNDESQNEMPSAFSEPFGLLMQGLKLTLNQFAQKIRSGETPDLNTLGSQLTEALQRFPSEGVSVKAAVSPTPPAFDPGQTPLEARKLPAGMDQKKAAEKSKEMNEAIAKNDINKLRDLSNDKEAMAVASPQEKASMVRMFSEQSLTTGKGNDDKDRDRQAINKVLQSAGSPAEYKSIMQSAGPELVQNAMRSGVKAVPKTGVTDPKKDKEVSDFNITAGALSSMEYATDPEQAKLGTDALAKGYTPDQIIKARQEMHEKRWHGFAGIGRKDDDLVGMAEKPLNMLVSTTSEKADMAGQLLDGNPNTRGQRAAVSVLQSAQDKSEFDSIVKQTGSSDIWKKFGDDEARKKFDTLAGAYERADLANDKKQADAAFGALTDPAKTAHYLGGASSSSVPSGKASIEAIQTKNTNGPLSTQTDAFIASNQAKVQSQVSALDRRALVDSVVTNIDREKEGKPMINPQNVRHEINSIMNDFRLNEEQKKEKIEELRKKQDVSEYTLRNIATQPISHIYNHAAGETSSFAAPRVAALEENVKRAEARYGKESAQAEDARRELQRFQSKIGPYASNLQQVGKTLGDLYPPPKEWYEKIADFFLGIFKNFAPMLLNLIPGVGSALYGAYQVGKSIYDATQGNFLGAIGGIAGAVPGLGEVMGGAGEALKTGAGIVQKGVGVGKAVATGDVLGAVGGIAGGIPGTDALNSVSTFAQKSAGIAQGLASGDVAKVLDGVGSLAPERSVLSNVTGLAKQSLQTIESIRKGNFSHALTTIGGELEGIGSIPPALSNFANQGNNFINNVLDGKYPNTLQDVAKSFEGSKDPLWQQAGHVAQQGATFFSHLRDGSFNSNLKHFGLGLGTFALEPSVIQVSSYLHDMGSLVNNLRNANQPQFIQQSANLISSVSSGKFRSAFESLGVAANAFSSSPGLLNTLRDAQAGDTFLNGLLNGTFLPFLTQLTAEFTNQAGTSQIMETALNMTIQASNFLKTLVNKDFDHSLKQLIKFNSGREDLKHAQSALSESSSFFGALANGQMLQSFDQYQQQLRSIYDSVLLNSMLRDFESEAKKLSQNRDLEHLLSEESKQFENQSNQAVWYRPRS